MGQTKQEIFQKLESEILKLQGFSRANNPGLDLDLGPMRHAFPRESFPTAAIHEFIGSPQGSAAATGFIAAMVAKLVGTMGTALWISRSVNLFPPALKCFGISPERIVFASMKNDREVAWAIEESLKCTALSAVIGEVSDLDFTTSRRLQLAVERTNVTGFILNMQGEKLKPTACVSRWKIRSLASDGLELPGVGFPRWQVDLVKIRNGHPGSWTIQWIGGKFEFKVSATHDSVFHQMKAG